MYFENSFVYTAVSLILFLQCYLCFQPHLLPSPPAAAGSLASAVPCPPQITFGGSLG